MKVKVVLVALFCLIAVPSTGCITNTSDEEKALAAWKSGIESGLNQVRSQVTTMQAQIAEKVSMAQVDEKIKNVGQGNSYSKTETYTRTEIDQKITDAIKALKDDANAPWQKKTTGNTSTGYVPTTPGSTSPLQTYSTSGGNGAVQIALQGYPQPMVTASTPVNQSYFVTLTNTSAIPQYFVPTVTIQPATGNISAGITSGNVTAQYGTYALEFNPIPTGDQTVLITVNAIKGGYTGGAIYVTPNIPGLLVVTLTNIKSNNPATWNVTVGGSSSNVY